MEKVPRGSPKTGCIAISLVGRSPPKFGVSTVHGGLLVKHLNSKRVFWIRTRLVPLSPT